MAATGILVPVENCKNWDKNGKNETLKLCRSLVQTSQNSLNQGKDIKQVFYEICWHVLRGNLKQDFAVSALGDIVQNGRDLPSQLADVFVLVDIETQCSTEQRLKFIQLLSTTCSKKVVPEHIIKERLDFETTGEAGILKSTKGSHTKFIKIKTRLFYKQQKFNLFREESEGYAKLIAELNQEDGGKRNATYMLEVIQSLIGCFNLDPNRVLDIILESFECNLNRSDHFVTLLESFLSNSTTISQVLGFKFGFYQTDGTTETPETIYKVAALLLQSGLITLEQIYSVLTPDDVKISDQYKHNLQEARVYARKTIFTSTSVEKSDESKEDGKEVEKQWIEENQKLGLCAALLEVGDWEHGQKLMERMPEFFGTSHPDISRKLCQLIHYMIDPLYRKYSGLPSALKQTNQPRLMSRKVSVKQITSFSELQQVFPMVYALGPHMYLDPVLMVKIIRLSKAFLCQKNPSRLQNCEKGVLEYDILSVLDETLLPALSLLDCNCCMAEEIWSLIRLFPYQHRYRLYGEWKNVAHLTHPLLIKTKADTLKKIKYIMKRLSKENVKPSGRQIGKLSHSNPGFLFDYILSQVQTWDNLIGPVVDSLKYLTSLSYDVLAYCVIEALSNSEKERVKHDGTSISLWLQSLANFCGAVFRKYPIDLTGLLQFVGNQLKSEKSLDLLLLKEIVQKMAGIEASDEMTNEQLEAMAGGELLKAEGGYFTQMRNTKKSSQRLKEALLEQDLAVPLCLLMAQQKNCIIFREQEHSHLKLIGKLFDQCQDTLVQYGTFLANSLNIEDYSQRLPSIDKLLSEYHIQADVAFFLTRPMFAHAVTSKYEELRKADKGSKNSSTAQKCQKYSDAALYVAEPIMHAVCFNPSKICEDLSPSFYVMFWLLSMYDLYVPCGSYEREVTKLKTQISQIDDNKDMVQSKKKKEKERCHALMEKLQDEEKKQQEHCGRVLSMLKSEKDNWFQSRSAKNETITQFLQLCIFPRCIFTSVDALYCAKFVHLIHTLKTPNFSTLICYDRIFCDVSYTVTCCTENEANRYGKFLSAMLETVMCWHSDKTIFDKECTNFPGFMTKFKGSSQSQDSSNDHVDYENYRHVCHKWHFRITKALVICLESGDFTQIRNTLIVLTKVISYFPVITNLGLALERRIEKIRLEEKDKRADLFALATGYLGQLKSKKTSLVPEHEFHLKETTKTSSSTSKPEGNQKVSNSNSKENNENADSKPDFKSEQKLENLKPPAARPNASTRTSSSNSSKTTDHSSRESSTKDVSRDEKRSEGSVSSERKEKRGEDGSINYHHHQHPLDGDSHSDSSGGAPHSQRRFPDAPESDKGHKRRRVDTVQTKSPKVNDAERESRSCDRSLEEVHDRSSSSRERNKEKTPGRDSSTEKSAGPTPATPPEKPKPKEKKISRKKEHSENISGSQVKRRKEDDQSKRETSEVRDRERHSRRQEDSSLKVHDRIKERRSEKEDKKHYRTSSAPNIAPKKRS